MSKHENASLVRIHIDGSQYESPNPTTGAALYALGQIEAGLELYRGAPGAGDEWPVENGVEDVHLNDNDHFHSSQSRTITIIVEGRPFEWQKNTLTYAEVVTLFDPAYPQHSEITYSVKYKRGQGNKPEGTLAPGASVKVKNGMMFNVSSTGQS